MRGKGIAGMMINNCCDWCKKNNINFLEIKANLENVIENKMWFNIGFIPSHMVMIKKI